MDQFYVDPVLYSGRTDEKSGEKSKQKAVYSLLEKLDIPFFRADHTHADTIADCARIELVLGDKICKNLFLRNRQGTEYYLLLMPGDKTFRTATVSTLLGVARLSFADSGELEKYLGLTPGSVTVLGLAHEGAKDVHLLIDRQIAQSDYICCHPCLNTSTLKIATRDIFEKFLPYTGHEPQILDIPYPEQQ